MVWSILLDAPSPVATAAPQGAKVFAGRVNPPPLTDSVGPLSELALLTRLESRNKTTTVMSSWKCLRTPRSIFFRSEYLISRFFAASCSAAFTSLRALPCIEKPGSTRNRQTIKRLLGMCRAKNRPSDANMRNWSCGSSSCTEIDGSELNMGLSNGSRKRNLAYKGSLLYSAFLSRKLDGKNLPRRLHKPPHDSARISEISNVKDPVANNPDKAARSYSSHLRVHWPLFGNQRKKSIFCCLKCFPNYIH
nr:hypothetical protein BVRB_6g152710 [Ipomoea trifida]